MTFYPADTLQQVRGRPLFQGPPRVWFGSSVWAHAGVAVLACSDGRSPYARLVARPPYACAAASPASLPMLVAQPMLMPAMGVW